MKKSVAYILTFGLAAVFVLLFHGAMGSDWGNTLICIGIIEVGLGILCIDNLTGMMKSPYDFPNAPRKWRVLYTIGMILLGMLFFVCIECIRYDSRIGLIVHSLLFWGDAVLLRICLKKSEAYKEPERVEGAAEDDEAAEDKDE